MKHYYQVKLNASKGLTLIELIIAMSLGLFLLAGAVQIVIASKQTYQMNRDHSWMQENARFAIDTLTKDIRMAGYWGCNNDASSIANTLNAGSGYYLNFLDAIGGYDGDQNAFPNTEFPTADRPTLSSGSLPKSDVIIISRADSDGEFTVSSHNPNSAVINIVSTHPYSKGKILVITNCTKTAIFQTTGNQSNKFNHNTGSSASPGNCTQKIRFPVICSNANSAGNPPYDFDSDGQAVVMAALANGYYIDTASSGLPVLYRKFLDNASGIANEQLAQGIESLQLMYGEDISGDGISNRFVAADNVTDWTKVMAVKLHLLTRSLTQSATEPQVFRFSGTSYTPTDKYLRQEFTSTVKIRNRG